ncbi:MAG TPA: FAD synthetase family protein [Candidatus Limnocylindrales bacterium]|nr:FAD synthetase family protein [Candidatus Limnocylindrales bacterium]
MDVLTGVAALQPAHGPIFAVIGVFDGLHRGHVYLLDHLVREALARHAHPCVITFDHHPDEVLTGSAPPLLLHPDERVARLGDAGVAVTVVQHFDDAVRHTAYDDFVGTIRAGTDLAGLLMTPDAAFGYQRAGTPDAVRALGEREGFDLVVVDPLEIDGRAVRSSDIRSAIERGDLATAGRLLGRPFGLRGAARNGRLTFEWPMAMPPGGDYAVRIDGRPATVTVDGATVHMPDGTGEGTVRLEFVG